MVIWTISCNLRNIGKHYAKYDPLSKKDSEVRFTSSNTEVKYI